MPKKQQKGKSLSSFYFRFLQPGDEIIGFLESAVHFAPISLLKNVPFAA